MPRLYALLLNMLDRADQWEAYLTAWEAIRANTSYALRYDPTARLTPTTMAPFILRREPGTLSTRGFLDVVLDSREAHITFELRKTHLSRAIEQPGVILHHAFEPGG